MPNNANSPKGNDPRRKVIRVRFNFSWLYLILILGIGWLLLNNSGANPQKIEWAEVQEMFLKGDIKEIDFVRNDFKGNITVRPDRLNKYADKFGGKVPASSPHFIFLVSDKFDAEKEFGIKPEGFNAEQTDGAIDQSRFESVCRQLMARFPRCKKVAITLRGSINANHNTWGGVIFNGERLFQSRRYDITHIVDRVGGGDSSMGGLIYGLLTYKDDQQAIDFAAAASALKHTIFGDFNQASVKEVENLMKGNGSGRVSR